MLIIFPRIKPRTDHVLKRLPFYPIKSNAKGRTHTNNISLIRIDPRIKPRTGHVLKRTHPLVLAQIHVSTLPVPFIFIKSPLQTRKGSLIFKIHSSSLNDLYNCINILDQNINVSLLDILNSILHWSTDTFDQRRI